MEIVAVSTLREVAAQYSLQQFLQERQKIGDQIKVLLDQHTDHFGLEIENILIKDIILPAKMQDALSAAARQSKLSEAKVINAQADVDSALLLKESSEILNSKSAMQIRLLECINKITETGNQKTLYLPLNSNQFCS